ncbi:unnamed protein product [Phyllotreta striolata]|uniref:Uncharacterized protein n=1 Tax=Phyllotreta striolata TaxID=444603 RepID=A0A9N9TQ43_PHYSR|nr:unnamed protein product [Phyllotreta striolata]
MEVPICEICKRNLLYPPHQRSICPYHPHLFPPSAPAAPPPYYPPAGGNYYPPPPAGTSYPGYYPPPPPEAPYSAHSWVDSSIGRGIPSTAVRAGTDIDGHAIYIGKAYHEGDTLPAKIVPGRNACYIAYNGKEHLKTSYQVLCNLRPEWTSDSNGRVPSNAVVGGRTKQGETLYIGRVFHQGSLTIGKIHPSHGTCYISFGGAEISYKNYEVLISDRRGKCF